MFNDSAGIPVKEKQRISGKEMGKIRSARTLKMINEAVSILSQRLGRRPTQKKVAHETGKNLRTVKRYFKGDVRCKGKVEDISD